MLDKYFAKNDFNKKKNCCDNHPVLKKYSIDPLKTSPSVSGSSSISSSELSVSLEKKPESDLEKSLPNIVASVLADEPDEGNCCIKLWNHLVTRNEVIKF
jgi:hypothetical protein